MRALAQHECYQTSGAGYFDEQLSNIGAYLGTAVGVALTPILMSMGYMVGPVLVIPITALGNHFSQTGENYGSDIGSHIDSILALEFFKPVAVVEE